MKTPSIHETAFLAPDAAVYGDVTVSADASIWFHATVRAENAPVCIGAGSNVQDNAVIHVDPGHPVSIGESVTIGHSAIVHGCTIGDGTLVGMGAIILNGAVIGKNCLIGAGALVTQNTQIPDGSLVIGSPAVVKRPVRPDEIESSRKNALHYVEKGKEYAAYFREKHD